MKLHKIYHPITATPYKYTSDYMEFEPCAPLKPYIRCFWGSRNIVLQKQNTAETYGIVIPDTCMDIIFTADFTNNSLESRFCGIDDRTFIDYQNYRKKKTYFVFAIRFYAWSVSLFAQESMRSTKNAFFDAGYHFPKIKKEIERQLFDTTNINQLIPTVEKILLNLYYEKKENNLLFQATSKVLQTRGTLSMTDLTQDVLVSSRQLERLFLEYIGVSPKSFTSMVRYQYLWNELLYRNDFNIADAVYKYGYSDQAHLCHDFKKYHSMNMSDAKKFALQNVGNIQDNSLLVQYNGQRKQ